MAEFSFPVKLPRFTHAEFTRKKAEYNAKYGYKVHIPALNDIIHIGLEKKPTETEVKLYKSKNVAELGAARYEEIKEHMAEKKAKFLRMMDSPSPTWARNVGSAMTFLDDINDTLGTMAVITRTAGMLLPATVGAALSGPAGWMLLGAEIANIALVLSRSPARAMKMKRDLERSLVANPFSKRAKVLRARKLKRFRPSKGEVIELLQTTDNMFGVGLCLGPILGLAQDIFFGSIKNLQGIPVQMVMPPVRPMSQEMAGFRALKAAQAMTTGQDELSDRDHTKVILAAQMATQVVYPYLKLWHPLDNIKDMKNIAIGAPSPTDPSTIAVLEDAGINWKKKIGWLHLNKPYASLTELWDVSERRNRASFRSYAQRNKHNYEGLVAGQMANDYTQNILALTEGEENVVLDYDPVEKGMVKMFLSGYIFRENVSQSTLATISQKIINWDDQGLDFSWEEMKKRLDPDKSIFIKQA